MRRTFCSEMGAREAKKWQLARPRGFEPLAPRFVAWCSVQLSYGRVNVALSWNCVEASILCGFSTMRLGRDTRGYQTAGEAWESARQEFEAATRPQERSCTRERSETCPKGRAQDVCGSIRSHPREKTGGFSLSRLPTAQTPWPRPYSRAPESHMCLNLNIGGSLYA